MKYIFGDLTLNYAFYRQEDAQEFLSFIMDQMHDELLKLNGNFSNRNDGENALISSAEDDGWETVGPKNKSAVTRTQSFMPSQLSAIFGGQFRSVVKARGEICIQSLSCMHIIQVCPYSRPFTPIEVLLVVYLCVDSCKHHITKV